MSKSIAIHLDEVRAVFHLVGECRELGHDPILWQTHLAEGLTRLVRCWFVQCGEFRLEDRRPVPVCAIEYGWPDESSRRRATEWYSRFDLPDNIQLEVFLDHPEPNLTCGNGDLMSVAEWE